MEQYPPIPQKLEPAGGGSEPTTSGTRYYPPTPGRVTPSGGTGGAGSTVPSFNRQDFVKSYANMVARTWTDDTYLQLVLASPAETLAKAGMPTISGAVIRIVQHKITGMGKIEDQVDAWLEGNRTGLYDLFLPFKPEDVDIAPEGGAPGSAEGGGDACCCCSPCCCCT